MQKIYLKPISSEIIAKGALSDGYSDIFSYEPDSADDFPKLGNLFVVGHVHHETDDMAYLVNLVAALAKREYYARPHLPPKEAFAGTLVKINDVVEEFFRNKGLEMNIGIFVIAGAQIFISKIGKFKIFLARHDRDIIDVLNNVDLFAKEHIENREFSNILSGKIEPKDRLLAFYPGQGLSSRERYIKSYFLKLAEAEFTDKISDIRSKNENFSCSLLYISLEHVKETAKAPRIEPQELAQVQLAAAEKIAPSTSPAAVLTDASAGKKTESHIKPALVDQPVQEIKIEAQELPRIIPSEFSLGRRDNIFTSLVRRFRLPRMRMRLTQPVKIGAGVVGVVLAVSIGLFVKSKFFISQEVQTARNQLKEIHTSVADAQSKIDQKDPSGARNMLFATLATITDTAFPSGESANANKAKEDILKLLDTIDNTQEVTPSLFYQIAPELGQATLLASFEGTLLAYSHDTGSNTGYVSRINKDSTAEKFSVEGIAPEVLFENSGSPALFSRTSNQVASLKNGTYSIHALTVPANYIHGSMYQDNLYVLATDGIFKITDAAKGSQKSQAWLAKTEPAPADGLQILVDGDLHVLFVDGTIATYYKGKRASEIKAPFTPTSQTVFLSSSDSSSFYLFRRDLNRIYVLDRKSGNLTKTYKISSQQPITAVALGTADTVYFPSADNKIWIVK